VTVRAFMDESTRGDKYLLCAVIVEPGDLKALRRHITGLLLPGQHELHFHNEKEPRKRVLADRIARLSVTVTIYRTATTPRTEEHDRQRCLDQAVRDLRELRAHRLVMDTRKERDQHDKATIRRVLGHHARSDEFTYHHVASECEPLVWVADVAAWCFGAGSDWRRRISPIVQKVIDL
jgi:hypothetical protein